MAILLQIDILNTIYFAYNTMSKFNDKDECAQKYYTITLLLCHILKCAMEILYENVLAERLD